MYKEEQTKKEILLLFMENTTELIKDGEFNI